MIALQPATAGVGEVLFESDSLYTTRLPSSCSVAWGRKCFNIELQILILIHTTHASCIEIPSLLVLCPKPRPRISKSAPPFPGVLKPRIRQTHAALSCCPSPSRRWRSQPCPAAAARGPVQCTPRQADRGDPPLGDLQRQRHEARGQNTRAARTVRACGELDIQPCRPLCRRLCLWQLLVALGHSTMT